jgi:antitoxin (DNA-binding transcriptional repressor) of toxin-antitoxin stability system
LAFHGQTKNNAKTFASFGVLFASFPRAGVEIRKVIDQFLPIVIYLLQSTEIDERRKKIMDAKTISLTQAQTYLATLAAPLKAGEEIVIVRDNTPLAKLVAPTQPLAKNRTFGRYKGKIKMSDDFDAPLPDDFWLGGILMKNEE